MRCVCYGWSGYLEEDFVNFRTIWLIKSKMADNILDTDSEDEIPAGWEERVSFDGKVYYAKYGPWSSFIVLSVSCVDILILA